MKQVRLITPGDLLDLNPMVIIPMLQKTAHQRGVPEALLDDYHVIPGLMNHKVLVWDYVE